MKLQRLWVVAVLCLQALGAFIWDPSQIVKQRASDAVHDWYEQTGNDIMCALMSTDMGAGVQLRDMRAPPSALSPWWGRREDGFKWNGVFEGWYWFRKHAHPEACDFDRLGWTPTINELKPLLLPANWKCRRWLHHDPASAVPIKDQKYRKKNDAGGKKVIFQATGAEYNHAFHTDGIILFQQSRTPITAAHLNWGGTVRQSAMPKLYHQSDFMWADWKGYFKGADEMFSRRIDFCGNANANDLITYSLLARYLVAKNQYDLEDWPAPNSQWSTQSPEGRALLASPAAMQCRELIMRHKNTLRIRYITNIRVFRGPPVRQRDGTSVRYPQFVFEIKEVPQNLVKPDPPADFQLGRGPGNRPPIDYIPVQINPDFDVPGPSNPQPGPSNPQPGPSNPQPGPPPKARAAGQEMPPEISYKVRHEGNNDNFVRVHTFQLG